MRNGIPIYLGNGPTPCYDPKTDTHCPNRKVGCAGSCSAWAEYIKKRNERYKKKLDENEANSAFYMTRDDFKKRNRKFRQYKIDQRRRKK